MLLRTHYGDVPQDPTAAILSASPKAKVIIPKSAAESVHADGISYHRMTTTDADLRVEYFKNGVYGRVYSVPSSREGLHWTPLGGYPYLGYLIRFGEFTIYHPGSCEPYEGLAERLNPYNVTVALLPLGEKHFSLQEAADLAKDASIRWLVPMQCDPDQLDRFALHMLSFKPEQRFKIFEPGEGWTIPLE
jgi:L-ascorbate metabolism protein UlaG (beta-lactamase superfamily)